MGSGPPMGGGGGGLLRAASGPGHISTSERRAASRPDTPPIGTPGVLSTGVIRPPQAHQPQPLGKVNGWGNAAVLRGSPNATAPPRNRLSPVSPVLRPVSPVPTGDRKPQWRQWVSRGFRACLRCLRSNGVTPRRKTGKGTPPPDLVRVLSAAVAGQFQADPWGVVLCGPPLWVLSGLPLMRVVSSASKRQRTTGEMLTTWLQVDAAALCIVRGYQTKRPPGAPAFGPWQTDNASGVADERQTPAPGPGAYLFLRRGSGADVGAHLGAQIDMTTNETQHSCGLQAIM